MEIVLVLLDVLEGLRPRNTGSARAQRSGKPETRLNTHIEDLMEPPQSFAVLALLEVQVPFFDQDPQALHLDEIFERRRRVLLFCDREL